MSSYSQQSVQSQAIMSRFSSNDDLLQRLQLIKTRLYNLVAELGQDQNPFKLIESFTRLEFMKMLAKYRPQTPLDFMALYEKYFGDDDTGELSKEDKERLELFTQQFGWQLIEEIQHQNRMESLFIEVILREENLDEIPQPLQLKQIQEESPPQKFIDDVCFDNPNPEDTESEQEQFSESDDDDCQSVLNQETIINSPSRRGELFVQNGLFCGRPGRQRKFRRKRIKQRWSLGQHGPPKIRMNREQAIKQKLIIKQSDEESDDYNEDDLAGYLDDLE